MKNSLRTAFLIGFITLLAFSGCTDITKSSNYKTYELKYIVNLTNVETVDQQKTIEELKNTIKKRLNTFDVAEVNIEEINEENNEYIKLNFGSINNIEDIKARLETNNELQLKLKLDVVYPHPRLVEIRHILVAYSGADNANEDITRTKQEAKDLANELKEKINLGTNFEYLVETNSDDKSTNKSNGDLETPAGRGAYVEAFENAALALQAENEVSDVVETPLGFHLIKAIKIYDEVLEENVDDYKDELEAKAAESLEKIKSGEDFKLVAQNQVMSDPARIVYSQTGWMFKDEIKEVFAQYIFDMEPGEVYPELIKFEERAFALAPPIGVISLMKQIDKREFDKKTEFPKEVEVSHILIAYKDAKGASQEITRTKEEAFAIAEDVKSKLDNGSDFVILARDYSDDESNNNNGGKLEPPAGQDSYVPEFENAALELTEEGQLSDIVESDFGFHIIKANSIKEAIEETNTEQQVKFEVLFYALQPKEWNNLDFTGDFLSKAETIYLQEYDPYIVLHFNDKGKEALKKLTEENNNEIIGIFLGKDLITSFTVREPNIKGELTILQPQTTKEADDLLEQIRLGTLPAPIVLVYDSSMENTDTEATE